MQLFETERVPLVEAQATGLQSKRVKVIIGTAIAVVSCIVLACVVSYSLTAQPDWVNERTPNVLVALTALNRMTDMKAQKDSALSQVNQIKFRSDSLASLPKETHYNSYIDVVVDSWKDLMTKDELLTSFDKDIAANILKTMENYQKLRSAQPTIDLEELSENDEENMLYKTKSFLTENWNKIKSEIKDSNVMKSQIAATDKFQMDLAFKLPSKLCSELAWYKRWWNTMKGWFGSKPTNCLTPPKNLLNLGVGSATLCSKLVWYKRWWNSVKGWFGCKPTNCMGKNIFMKDSVTLALKRCSELPWYTRWWNSVKGWFGSKAKCLKLEIDLASKQLCSKLPWYTKWWNTMKGWFGSKADCLKGLEMSLVYCKDRAWYTKAWDTVKGWFGSKKTCTLAPETVAKNAAKKAKHAAKKVAKANKKVAKSAAKALAAKAPAAMAPASPPKVEEVKAEVKPVVEAKAEVKPVVEAKAEVKPVSETKPADDYKTTTQARLLEAVEEVDLRAMMGRRARSLKRKGGHRTNLLAIKLCSSLPWYTRWWNTIKGWFGSKPNCIKLAALELGTKFCKDLAWYTRWWNTVKGWFGSKADCLNASEITLLQAKCSSLAWYKRWWNNMKGFFGSKADCMKFSEVNLAMKMCKDLAWYSRWWNTFKGWFGSKSSCVELMNLMTACNKLPWYSRWWNSMKGWFGSKPTNCVKNIAVPVNEKIALRIPESKEERNISTLNENDGALQVVLANFAGAENVKLNVAPVYEAAPGRNTFIMLSDLADSYTRLMKKSAKTDFKLTQAPASKENWFRKFSEVFRQKGTAMELYEEPAARDLLEKVPSFADEKAMNEAVKFMDMFERSKSVILAQDKVDKQFLAYVEKMIMTWATSAESDKKEFSELLAKNTEVEGLM